MVRVDRLARSPAHLLEVLDQVRAAGAHFRSLSDPIDTASPTGRLVLQVIGAIAEFERNLIAEPIAETPPRGVKRATRTAAAAFWRRTGDVCPEENQRGG